MNAIKPLLILVIAHLQFSFVRADEEVFSQEELALVKAAQARRVESVAKVYGAVVAVYGNDRKGGGSAVIYDQSGLALTNHHVVAAAGKEGFGGLADGRLYRWKLIGTDPGGDVAIIKLTGKDQFPAAPLGNSDLVRVGDWAMAMGNPFLLAEDQKPTVTLGIVSGVKRYQPGSGLNMLVYGNCIQIDSSINPGNSGGPLFSMRGEVIGINGRGSFKERGRVNVGLGYAISANQVKNFLPDLLATKVAQHGTLDALFGKRSGKVVCETINLDAPIADLGLELGDELLEFEGVKISTANQFTNIISTLPAEWPAHLVVNHDGQRKEIWARLLALPYQTHKPQPMPKKDDKDKEKKPKIQIQRGPKIAITDPGTIRDETLNQEHAEYVISRWKQDAGIDPENTTSFKSLRFNDRLMRGGVTVGEQTVLLAVDGRFRVDVTQGDESRTFGFDGTKYWASEASGDAEELSLSKALLNPFVAQVASLVAMFTEESVGAFGKVQLDGSGKALGRAAYRLKTTDDEGDWFYVWLSVVDEQTNLKVELLKASADIDGGEPTGAVTFSDWRDFQGVRLPYRRELVRGLAERSILEIVTTNCEPIEEISNAEFQQPGGKNE